MPKPSWQSHATQRDFSTRYDDVHITVFETQFDSYSYLVVKNDEPKPGNVREASLEEVQERALERVPGL